MNNFDYELRGVVNIIIFLMALVFWTCLSSALYKRKNNIKEYLNKNGIQVWHLLIVIPVCIFLLPGIIIAFIKYVGLLILKLTKCVVKPILTFKVIDMEKHRGGSNKKHYD